MPDDLAARLSQRDLLRWRAFEQHFGPLTVQERIPVQFETVQEIIHEPEPEPERQDPDDIVRMMSRLRDKSRRKRGQH